MSEGLLGEVTANYVLKNRDNGWLTYALQVLAAGPHLRWKLICELCDDVRRALEGRLPEHEVTVEIDDTETWFSVDVRGDAWGELGVTLGNWKFDASEVAVSVYSFGDVPSGAASAQIKDCLATKRSPWHRKRYPQWIWNVWPERWNWSKPDFLSRVADDREALVGEVTNDVMEIVEITDDLLRQMAKADSR